MVAVVGVGGVLAFTVPPDDPSPQNATVVPDSGDAGTVHSDPYEPESTDEPETDRPGKPPRKRPKPTEPGQVTIQEVPASGSAMEIVMPGDSYGAVTPTTVDIVVSSFNVLGSSHTR